MPSFSIPLSGLSSSSEELSVIASNLSNMSTTGYKTTSTLFQDLVYQNYGSDGAGDPIQVGSGTKVSSVTTNFTQGSSDSTGTETDMEINGSGFFALKSTSGSYAYTRDGSFTLANDGTLESADGSSVLGWQSVNGTINNSTTPSSISIVLGSTISAKATSSVELPVNLNSSSDAASTVDATGNLSSSSSTVAASATVYDSDGTAHALDITYTKGSTDSDGNTTWTYSSAWNSGSSWSGSASTPSGTLVFDSSGNLTSSTSSSFSDTSGSTTLDFSVSSSDLTSTSDSDSASAALEPTYSTTATVYDSLGDEHTLTYNFTKTGQNTWNYDVTMPSSDVTGGTGTTETLASGTLGFNSSGELSTVNGSAVGKGEISLTTSNTLSDGASALDVTWDLLDSSGSKAITQTSSDSSKGTVVSDGYASGTLKSFSVDSDGTVEGTYSNGQTLAIAQVAVATFANEQGLERVGTNEYSATQASGAASIGVAGTSGRGTLQNDALEKSNVDIATEFANLIQAQRAYEANAKSMTTFDQVYQDTINLKQ